MYDLAGEMKLMERELNAADERIKRLEEAGVITGYSAVIDHERIGLPVLALVRLRYPTGNYKPFHDMLATTPEVLEAQDDLEGAADAAV